MGGFLWWHILLIAVAAVAVLVAIVAVIFVSPQSILCVAVTKYIVRVAVTKYILCVAITKFPCIGASEACMVLVNGGGGGEGTMLHIHVNIGDFNQLSSFLLGWCGVPAQTLQDRQALWLCQPSLS